MTKQITPIFAARLLMQDELYAFSSRTIADLFELNKFQASSLLERMVQSGLVARIERGKYLLLGLTHEKMFSNPLYIGCNLVIPVYISFWSALHFHGFTEQVPQTVFLATTRRKKAIAFHGRRYQFVTLKPEAFFGYRREMLAELPVVIADEAKAIIDSLALPEYAGGISEVAKALQNAAADDSLDLSVLIEYAGRLQNGSLSSRLGFLLESLGQTAAGLKASRGPVKLDSHRPMQGAFDKRWQLYINIELAELFPQGVA